MIFVVVVLSGPQRVSHPMLGPPSISIFNAASRFFGLYSHVHFHRHSTDQELIDYVKRRVPGRHGAAYLAAPSNNKTNVKVKSSDQKAMIRIKTGRTRRTASPTCIGSDAPYANTMSPQRNPPSDSRLVETDSLDHSPSKSKPNGFRPSDDVLDNDSIFSPLTTPNECHSFERHGNSDPPDMVQYLHIMSLPLIETPRKLDDSWVSPWADTRRFRDAAAGSLTLISADTPNALSKSLPISRSSEEDDKEDEGSLVDILGRQLASNFSGTIPRSPSTDSEEPVLFANATSSSPSTPFHHPLVRSDEHASNHKFVVTRISDPGITACKKDLPTSVSSPLTETSPIVPMRMFSRIVSEHFSDDGDCQVFPRITKNED